MTGLVVSDVALGPADAAFHHAVVYLGRRMAAIRPLDVAALPPDRAAAIAAIDAWAGDAATNWRNELVRWYEAHSPVLLTPDPELNGLLRRAGRAGVRLVVASPLPRAAAELYLSHLGALRPVEAVCAEEDGDALAAARSLLGDPRAPLVASREDLAAVLAAAAPA